MTVRFELCGKASMPNGGFPCWILLLFTQIKLITKKLEVFGYLKSKLKKKQNEVVSTTNQLNARVKFL